MKRTHVTGWGLIGALSWGAISAMATIPPAAVQPCSNAKDKMDDVYCIGDRRVARRSIISIEKEIGIGKQYAQQINQSNKLIKDPVITEYVNRIEQNIAENSDAKVPITIRVIDSPEINAFTLPGGFIYVNTGLLAAASSEAQLAGVLAHETAHVACRHWASSMTKESLLQYAMIPLIFTPMSYPVYIGVSEGLNLGIPMAFLKFSREDEAQADFLGIQYMWKAGYDPNAYLAMFGKIIQQQRRNPGSVPSIFMDHPPTVNRIIKAEREIKDILPQRDNYLVSTSEFQDVNGRLNTLLGAMRRNAKNENRPTLMVRQPSSQPAGTGKSGGQNQGNDQPPVLRRRD